MHRAHAAQQFGDEEAQSGDTKEVSIHGRARADENEEEDQVYQSQPHFSSASGSFRGHRRSYRTLRWIPGRFKIRAKPVPASGDGERTAKLGVSLLKASHPHIPAAKAVDGMKIRRAQRPERVQVPPPRHHAA